MCSSDLYDKNLGDSYRLTDKKNASVYAFDKNNNLIYKYDSDNSYDYFYKANGYGIGELAFKIDKDVSFLKRIKNDTYLIKASDKKSEEEKKNDKEESFYKELTSLPFWFNGPGYLKDDTQYFYLYDAKEDSLIEILKSDKDNSVGAFAVNDDLDKICYAKGDRKSVV